MATEYESGEQWDKPNGWRRCSGWRSVDLNVTAVILWEMRLPELAADGQPLYKQHHKLIEKYHIATGVPMRAAAGSIPCRMALAGPTAWCAD